MTMPMVLALMSRLSSGVDWMEALKQTLPVRMTQRSEEKMRNISKAFTHRDNMLAKSKKKSLSHIEEDLQRIDRKYRRGNVSTAEYQARRERSKRAISNNRDWFVFKK